MTALREAIVLPLIMLTVALLGGLRIGPPFALVAPPLVSLVLATLLLATLVNAGALAPSALLGAHRRPLENISGLLVLLTLFAASTQVFTLVTPDDGLLHAVFGICFFVQLTTTLAGVTRRRQLLRSLAVLLGAAFVLRFVVLESLYASNSGFAKRLLTTMVEGASLGAIHYAPTGRGTGYLAFSALALYMIGLVLLPSVGSSGRRLRLEAPHGPLSRLPLLLLAAVCACSGCNAVSGQEVPARGRHPGELRNDALRRARVWAEPSVPIAEFDFAANPSPGFSTLDDVTCRFVVQKVSGMTQKFYCQLPDGRMLKVKYGHQNAEVQAEVAGTRLLRALGFAADDMSVVHAVHCTDCPRFPFQALKCNDRVGLEWLCFNMPPGRPVRTFTAAAIERRLEGTPIEGYDDQGWSWFELDRVEPEKGGATRAELDAFRLMAVLLAHWDNKGPNQRLLCPSGRELADGGCAAPVAMIQDLGATFGPLRVDLPSWRATPIWSDRASCTISMKTMPFGGATFPERRISESGRRLLAGLLGQLSRPQLRQLFTASRITDYDQIDAEARNADAWVNVFLDKVQQIRDGEPCPQ